MPIWDAGAADREDELDKLHYLPPLLTVGEVLAWVVWAVESYFTLILMCLLLVVQGFSLSTWFIRYSSFLFFSFPPTFQCYCGYLNGCFAFFFCVMRCVSVPLGHLVPHTCSFLSGGDLCSKPQGIFLAFSVAMCAWAVFSALVTC